MKKIVATIIIVLLWINALGATPRRLMFSSEQLSEVLALEHDYRFNNAAVNDRAQLSPPVMIRFSAPGIGRVRAVFTSVRRFSADKPAWSSVNFQGHLLYQDGTEQPLTMSVRLDELVLFPILDKRGRAVVVYSPYHSGFKPDVSFAMKKRRDAKWHEGLQDCGQELSEHTVSSIIQTQLRAVTYKVVKMEMEGDSALVAKESDASGYIDDVLSAVETIYQRDLGVTFDKEKETIYSAATDPYTEDDGIKLLDEIQANNLSENVTLTHLITGRDTYLLDESNNKQYGLAGVARTGVVCNSTFNVGFSERASNVTTTSITMAHEVGHNFGASHPDEDEGYIMDAVGTPDTKSEFSTFSMNEITQFINQQGSCLTEVNVNAPTLSVTTDRKLGMFTFDVSFSTDRSACTFAIELAPNQAFSSNTRSFDGFIGRASSAQVTGSKRRRSSKGIYARVTVTCDDSEVSSDPVSIPQVKKIKSKKKKKLGFKKWMKLKKMTQVL